MSVSHTVNSIAPVTAGTDAEVLADVFSQKVGDWAFASAAPATSNPSQDIPSGFSLKPTDGVIMDYLEELLGSDYHLPAGHLYDVTLQSIHDRLPNGELKEMLGRDIELRDYLRIRRIGEVYE